MRLTAATESAREEASLFELQDAHSLWKNPLLCASREGRLTIEDFQFLFGQYFAYSRSFTRYLAALMVNCEDDLLRAKLIANLWEESGGTQPERRHSNLFRGFLREGLGLAPEYVRFEVPTLRFVSEYLDSSGSRDIPFATAFLAIGTEALVSRLYQDFVAGLKAAQVPEEQLEFFYIHIGCDDEHAETLLDILKSTRNMPHYAASSRRGVMHAMNLRDQFFRYLYRRIQERQRVA